jgi:hypothetical protein
LATAPAGRKSGATYGVLSMARRLLPGLRFFVVAKSSGELRMANGLRLLADYGFADVAIQKAY